MKDKSLTFASIAAAGLASLCCIGPLAAVALGIGSFSAASLFEGLRPYLLGLTALLLAGAFYLNYRKRSEAECEDGTCAVSPEKKRKQTMLLWLATGAVAAIAAFPHYSAVFWGESNQRGMTALAASRSAETFNEAIFDVEGMTCPSCAVGIQATISRREGVGDVEVSYDDKSARVLFDPAKVSADDLIVSFKELGYEATPQSGS